MDADTVERRSMAGFDALLKGDYPTAQEHLLWCWDHGHKVDPGRDCVRLSYWVGDLTELVRNHEPARGELIARRDGVLEELLRRPSVESALDLNALNTALGEPAASLEALDQLLGSSEVDDDVVQCLAGEAKDELIAAGRFEDAYRLADLHPAALESKVRRATRAYEEHPMEFRAERHILADCAARCFVVTNAIEGPMGGAQILEIYLGADQHFTSAQRFASLVNGLAPELVPSEEWLELGRKHLSPRAYHRFERWLAK